MTTTSLGLLAALIFSATSRLTAAEGVGWSPTSRSFDEEPFEVCEAPQERGSDELCVLQTVLEVRDRRVPMRSAVRPLCQHPHSGLKVAVLLTMPFVALMVLAACSLVTWLELGRREARDSEAETGPPAAQSSTDVDREVPPLIWAFMASGNVMLSVNFSIVLPGSERTMLDAGGNTFLSGLAIGSYALGSIISFPLLLYWSRHSYRTAVIFMAFVAVLGNLAYAAVGVARGGWAIAGMILARTLCGLEGGVIIVFGNALLRLSSGAPRIQQAGMLTFYGCLGLGIGPCLSALSEMSMPHVDPELPPALLMMALSTIYGVFAVSLFPHQDECFKMAGFSGYQVATVGPANPSFTDVQLRTGWLNLALQSTVNCVRLCQRVLWEAGALLIFVREYGYSERVAAFILVVPVILSTPLIRYAGHFNVHVGPSHFVRSMSLIELGGILLMFQVFINPKVGIGVFIFASFLFYGSNLVSMVPLVPLRAKFALRGHWVLSLETSTGIIWICSFAGYFFGPVLSRAALSVCPHQNLLAITTLLIWIGSALSAEISMHSLLREGKC